METNQRELFEKWVRSRPEHKRGDLNTRNDEYWDEIALAWRAWQAALASAPAVEAESDVKARITKRLEEYLAWLYSGKDKRPPLASDLANVVCAELQPSATQPDVVEADVLRVAKLAHLVHTDGKEKWEAADQYRWENTARWVISDINTHNAAMPNHIADTSKMVEARRNALMEARDAIGELKVDKAFKWDASCEIMRLIKLAEATTDGEKG